MQMFLCMTQDRGEKTKPGYTLVSEKNFAFNNKIIFQEFPIFRRALLVSIKFGIHAPRNTESLSLNLTCLDVCMYRCIYIYLYL